MITKLDTMMDLCDETSPAAFRNAVDASVFRSCRELRTQRLHTVLLHRWRHRHACGGTIWSRLLELREQGVIQNLGTSVSVPSEALEALFDEDVKHIQVPFNVASTGGGKQRDSTVLAGTGTMWWCMGGVLFCKASW